jgi:hypothetical protein
MAGRGSRKTTFDKLQRERARREKQAAKRARRQGGVDRSSDATLRPLEPNDPGLVTDPQLVTDPESVPPTEELGSADG